MTALQQELLNAVFRWIHVVAGVVWLGHLYFFNLVQTHVARQWSVDGKENVAPLLLPRAHFWMRWGALISLGSGLILLGVVYQAGALMVDHDTEQTVPGATLAGLGAMALSFVAYDLVWKSKIGKHPRAAAALCLILLAALIFTMAPMMSGRALYVHLGAVMATVMALNIWLRIWPAQRRVLTDLQATSEITIAATDASALIAQRSRHNLYLSVPATFFMVSNHFPSLYTTALRPLFAAGATILGFALGWIILRKSASDSLTSF